MVVTVFLFESVTVLETTFSRFAYMELASDTAAPEVGATDRLVTDFDVEAVVGAALLIGAELDVVLLIDAVVGAVLLVGTTPCEESEHDFLGC